MTDTPDEHEDETTGGSPPEAGDASEPHTAPAAEAAVVPAAAKAAAPATPPKGPHDPVVASHHDTLAVAIAKTRKRPPFWAAIALVALPVWGLLYLNAMTKPGAGANDPLVLGGQLYATNCASCHGGTGGGVSGPALNGGAVVKDFPDYKQHLDWVKLGAKGWAAKGNTTVGANKLQLPPSGGMPGFGGTLTDQEIAQIVYFERVQFGNEAPNPDLLALTTAAGK